jgi:hypothetical protein
MQSVDQWKKPNEFWADWRANDGKNSYLLAGQAIKSQHKKQQNTVAEMVRGSNRQRSHIKTIVRPIKRMVLM